MVESRIQSRIAESVEDLASIIKDYARKHKKLSDRLLELETNGGKKSTWNSMNLSTSKVTLAKKDAISVPKSLTTPKEQVHSPPVKEGESRKKLQNINRSNSKVQIKRKESDKENNTSNLTTTTHGGSFVANKNNFRTSFEEKLFNQRSLHDEAFANLQMIVPPPEIFRPSLNNKTEDRTMSLNNSLNDYYKPTNLQVQAASFLNKPTFGSFTPSHNVFENNSSAFTAQLPQGIARNSANSRSARGGSVNKEYTLQDLEKITSSIKKI